MSEDLLAKWRAMGRREEAARQAWEGRLAAFDVDPARRVRASPRGTVARGLRRRGREAPRPTTSPSRGRSATRKASQMALETPDEALPRDDRRLGRPHGLEPHPRAGDGQRLPGGQPRGPLRLLGRARVRHGGRHERHERPPWGDPVRRHLPRLLGLREERHPPLRPDGHRHDLRDDARLDRARRGRADAPAGGAPGVPTRDPEFPRAPPGNAVETLEAWEFAVRERGRPSLLALSRQGVPRLRTHGDDDQVAKGAYVIARFGEGRDLTILATGTEVAIAVDAARALADEGCAVAVVSMPCWEALEAQPAGCRAEIRARHRASQLRPPPRSAGPGTSPPRVTWSG